MIHAVIFDHDGTLVDSERQHFYLWKEVLSRFSINFQEAEYKTEHSGIPTRENARHLINKYSLNTDPDTLSRLKENCVQAFLENSAFELIPGVIQCMQTFKKAGLKMAIATGARRPEIDSSVSTHKFDKYISFSATSDDTSRSKPFPDVYQLAASKLNVPCKHCIAIEDSATGLQSALAAGMECIVVRNAWSADQDFQGASAVVDTISQACSIILQKCGE